VRTTAERISIALKHHQAGQTAEAEQVYCQILQQQPDAVDALNLLGALVYQQGRFAEAVAYFQQVLNLRPADPNAHNSVGVALKGQGEVQAAVEHYRKALALQPEHAEVQNNLGNALRELGELEEAIAAYEQALALKPNYPEAHHNLGMGLKELGKLDEALSHTQEALLLKPNYPEAHHSFGLLLTRQGNLDEARTYYQQAIALKPDYAEAYNSLGNLLQQQGNHLEAIAQHERALVLKPDYPEAYQSLANALQQVKRTADAIAHYRRAIALRPEYAEAYNNLGNALQEQEDLEGAIAHYQKALELRPNFAEAMSNLGAAYKEQKQFEQAIAYFRQALEIRPDYAEVHNNLGNAYQEQGNVEAAIACYEAALKIRPDYAEIHSNLGNMLQQQGQFEAAFDQFERAIALQPDYAGAYNNWGIALRNSGQIDAAMQAYQRAIDLNPGFVEAQWNQALTQLMLGEFEVGFAGYEWRLQWSKFKEQNPPRDLKQPRWQGEPIAGQTLLLYSEQGMGDTIQFIRYATLAAERGARVIVECHPPLVELLRSVSGIAEILPWGSPLPPFDWHAPLMSLPHLFNTRLDTVPAAVPYLTVSTGVPLPPPRSIAQSAPELGNSGDCKDSTLKIGLVWSGNPQNPYNRMRTCPLEPLLALAQLPEVALYSLQKDLTAADAALLRAHPEVYDLRPLLTDFVATASLIQQLDLIISVDTAVTHLAGALGKPVWLLLPFSPDWRWLLDRPDTPWYPTVRLIRQPAYDDWDSVMMQVGAALAQRETLPLLTFSAPAVRAQPMRIQLTPPIAPSAKATASATPPIDEALKPIVRLYQAGKTAEAEQQCRHWVEQHPTHGGGWHLLGLMLHQQGRRDAAIAAYRQVIALQPEHYETYNNLGVALQEQQRLSEALACYEKALAVKPDYPDGHNNYANALREANRLEAAIAHYRQAIAYKPDYADAYNNLGLALFHQQEFQQAAAAYREAIAIRPNYAQAHNHLGNALKELGDFEQAAAHYQQALAIRPNYAKAYNNWGNIFRDTGDLTTATRYYDQAIALEPEFAEAHWNKALTLLIGGDLKPGFAEYEWRWQVKLPTFQGLRSFNCPAWDGSLLGGRTIFLHAEQGMGDIIQFVRYAAIVAQMGGRVLLECHPPLTGLLQNLPGVAQVLPYGTQPVFMDCHAPLLSLPHLLGTTIETVPATVPYLNPPQVEVKLPRGNGLGRKIGLVWSGNPENPYNRTRACPLELLLSLTTVPETQFYSLQKDLQPGEADLLAAHPEVCDLRPLLTDFVATANLIRQLDLVISVDTAVTHLAGALGKPVWLMLPIAPDWRWMLERSDSPWYPTARLFRQPAYGDWDSVIAQVRDALLGKTSQRKSTGKRLKPQRSAHDAQVAQVPEHGALLQTIVQLYHAGNLTEAERLCHQSLQQQPEDAATLHTLGVILCRAGRPGEAIPYLERVLQQQPGFVEAWSNLGSALQSQGQLEAAIAHYQQAIALQPDYADAYQNLAVALKDLDRLEEAIAACERVIALKPEFPDIYYNFGFMLRRLGRLDEAIAQYRRAIALQPEFVDAHKNLGHALLLAGDLPQGFAEYEWRWRQQHWSPRPFAQPLWDGSDLQGQTILLHAEQGMGDTIQFVRYADLVRDRGGRVIVECQPALVRLLQPMLSLDRVVAQGEPLPEFAVHAPLLSLPHILGTDLTTIPARVPYLSLPSDVTIPLFPAGGLKVGIVWAGNPSHKNNRYRSCGLTVLRSLLTLPQVRFYSLQKGEAVSELQQAGLPVVDLSGQLQDFADTAAAIAQLDLVISVDTAVAHLAGALGKPVWLLLGFAPDWRWMLEREDSPWYPTMRLFRQPQLGDWESVVLRVRQELERVIAPTLVPEVADRATRTIGIAWPLELQTDWGVCGLQLALHLKRLGHAIVATAELPALYVASLALAREAQLELQFWRFTDADCRMGADAVPWDCRTIGWLDVTEMTPEVLQGAQRCEQLIVSSTWSAERWRAQGYETLVSFWGVDVARFHPAPTPKLFGDRFVVFSGGAFGDRQGQDLTIAAFQAFQARHPEALLVAAWSGVTLGESGLQALPESAYCWLGTVDYFTLPEILREATVTLLPNRAIASPNPLALYSLACGTPTMLSANTGHLDLLRQNLGYSLQAQRPVVRSGRNTEGWGNSDVEEILETLERIYTHPQEARQRGMIAADFMQEWSWEKQMQRLLALLGEGG
jgi:tetratricopeptide (TPR) repeat protein/ADP-heptose:LPS heptosyltransferase